MSYKQFDASMQDFFSMQNVSKRFWRRVPIHAVWRNNADSMESTMHSVNASARCMHDAWSMHAIDAYYTNSDLFKN